MKWTKIIHSETIDAVLRNQISDTLDAEEWEWEYVCNEEHDCYEVCKLFNGLSNVVDVFDLDKVKDFYVVISRFSGYKYAFREIQGTILIARRVYNVKESFEADVKAISKDECRAHKTSGAFAV